MKRHPQSQKLKINPRTADSGSAHGILPHHAKSTVWDFPGQGEPYEDCGIWKFRGCLHVEDHNQATLDGSRENGGAYFKRFKRTCFRSECPVCYGAWSDREGKRAAHRLSGYRGKFRKVIHVTSSPSPRDYSKSFSRLRQAAYRRAKSIGLTGGMMIYHPFRKKNDEFFSDVCMAMNESRSGFTNWVFSPHFHILGFGWIHSTKKVEARSGWVHKNHGIRKSVIDTISYQLSHAGTSKQYHTVTWFGSCSYNVLKVDPLPLDPKPTCPYCDRELKEIRWIGDYEPPDQDSGFSSVDCWLQISF